MTELKPCPFCEGKATLWQDLTADRQFHILCGCGGRVGYFETEEEAVKVWNTRAEIERLLKLISAVKKDLDIAISSYDKEIADAKTEAIKEFERKIKAHAYYIDSPKEHRVVDGDDIDAVLKEMTEGGT